MHLLTLLWGQVLHFTFESAQHFDEVKSSSFRHSVGVCVLLPDLTLVSQQVCQQTVDTFKKRHLPTPKQNANT